MPNDNLPAVDAAQPDGAPVVPQEPTPVAPAEPTVGELQPQTDTTPKADPKSPSFIPKSRLDKEIQKRKEAERKLAEFEQAVIEASEEGGVEVSEGEHSLEEIEAIIEKKLAPLTERERQQKLDNVFRENYERAIGNMSEYKGIANPEVIKQLALLPTNASKTYSQLIEETYGNAVPGRRTIETANPGNSRRPEGLDLARARTDTAYFKEVMADPHLKAEYNKTLTDRIPL